MKATQVPIDRWLDKEDVVHKTMEDYLAIKKKNEILPFVTSWVDLEGITLSEISQTEKDKCQMMHLYLES